MRLFSRSSAEVKENAAGYKSSNAMAPAIWICASTTPILLCATYTFRDFDFLRNAFALFSILPEIVALGMYVYFGTRDPDNLRSDEFRLRSQAMTITEMKGHKFSVNSADIVAMANPYPYLPAIQEKTTAKAIDGGTE